MTDTAKPLAGRVALVTGSGRGLGRAAAERLAQMGAAVAVHDVSQEAPCEFGEASSLEGVAAELAERYSVRVVPVVGDVADEAAVTALAARAEAELGPVDILVNFAGGDIAARGGKPKPNDALGVPVEDIRAILDRNLIGTMLVCRAVVPGMRERRSGSVVNIASAAAHVAVPEGIAYAAAKAAVAHFSRCLALEVRTDGVRVNVVSPGPTRTARFLATRPTKPEMIEEKVSLHRYGAPEEIADAVAFLAGDGARFLTGQVLHVDGGAFLRSEGV